MPEDFFDCDEIYATYDHVGGCGVSDVLKKYLDCGNPCCGSAPRRRIMLGLLLSFIFPPRLIN